jgi:hypothetical protein
MTANANLPNTTGAEQAIDQAAGDGWTVISVKNDWACVF